ncbi:hypothetical protein ACS0TY_030269 [Phlomoides rotata]
MDDDSKNLGAFYAIFRSQSIYVLDFVAAIFALFNDELVCLPRWSIRGIHRAFSNHMLRRRSNISHLEFEKGIIPFIWKKFCTVVEPWKNYARLCLANSGKSVGPSVNNNHYRAPLLLLRLILWFLLVLF